VIDFLVNFSKPYGLFSTTAATGFLHNLEGAVGGFIFIGPYLDAKSPLEILTGACFFAIVFAFFLSTIITWRYSRILFFMNVMCWVAPGVIELLYPGASKAWFAPDLKFTVWGAPSLRPSGSISELICAMSILFLLGWCVTSLMAGIFLAGKRFRLVFDHMWLPVGLAAAVFVVWDSNTAQLRENIAELDSTVAKAVTVLDERVVRVKVLCARKDMQDIIDTVVTREVCEWAETAHKKLNDIKYEPSYLRIGIRFPSPIDFFSYGSDNYNRDTASRIVNKTLEINDYFCKTKNDIIPCEGIPMSIASLLVSKEIIASSSDAFMPRALPAAEIALLLNEVTANGSSLFDQMREAVGVSNRRWLSFVLIAFIAGAKAALSTREIYRDDVGVPLPKGKWGPSLFTNTPARIWRSGKQTGYLILMKAKRIFTTMRVAARFCALLCVRFTERLKNINFS
jgi:hypothetical protein